jgi:hypothetical protein
MIAAGLLAQNNLLLYAGGMDGWVKTTSGAILPCHDTNDNDASSSEKAVRAYASSSQEPQMLHKKGA